ncbi:hypothetical protein RclHR1_08650011 [Rhizophagus clarus]|uniref:F-box domain-containing protein n=1 Tax=Rhizophagus clarus TaxID=94130 RepID=A0A2Z6S1C9_9GLOM|nr:hypothetical protein RclHR1_08650011 [Rhizophagus clarus]GES75706.1 hypothetical protein GLOIN_2v1876023 [Rhizophagus clarus]
MSLTRLPNDCIYGILKYLKNDRTTLFKCLFVNRFWCKEAVPLLYANPFDNYGKNHYYLIVRTLILCFNETEIIQLKNLLCVEPYDFNIPSEYKPLFDYTKYLENVDSVKIIDLIVTWIKKIDIEYYCKNFKNFNIIITIFYKTIIRQCTNIRYLIITSSYFLNVGENIKTFTSNLSKLRLLRLNFNDGVNNDNVFEFLQGISKYCLNILKLEIGLHNNYSIPLKYFCSIMQNQNNLKAFKILNYDESHENLLNDLLSFLEFQKYSLESIEFEYIDFSFVSFENFINLSNLKYLSFHNCLEGSLDKFEILKFASFKLKELIFTGKNNWKIDHLLLMIKYFGSSLQKLSLSNLITIPLIENILTYCSNLITLEITIYSNMDLSIFSYLSNLKIRKLYLSFPDKYNDISLFVNLANNLPISIKEISFQFDPSFNLLYFKEFLDNCYNNLEIINSNYLIDLEFLKIILNYIEKNNHNLLILGIINLEKQWNDDEMNILDKIKNNGVKFNEFNRNYYKEYYYI